MNYRAPDPHMALRFAFDECRRAREDLRGAITESHAARARLIGERAQSAMLEIPVYEEVDAPDPGAPEPSIPPQIARYQSLAGFFASEAARLREEARYALAPIEARAYQARSETLRAPPRRVPVSYVMSEFLGACWLVLRWFLFPPILMMVGLVAYGMVRVQPLSPLAPLVLLLVYAFLRARERVGVLSEGVVAEILSRSEAYGMGSSKNWPMAMADGWTTTIETYSGPHMKTTIAYRLPSGAIGKVVKSGGPVYKSYVLARERHPGRGYPTLAFLSLPRPDADGEWEASVPLRVWMRNVVSIVLVSAWIAASLVCTFVPDLLPG